MSDCAMILTEGSQLSCPCFLFQQETGIFYFVFPPIGCPVGFLFATSACYARHSGVGVGVGLIVGVGVGEGEGLGGKVGTTGIT